jgi:hypothetical protein
VLQILYCCFCIYFSHTSYHFWTFFSFCKNCCTMIYSRTNQRRPVNSVEELDDPLFLFEKLLNEQEQLNLNLLKTILIRYKSDDRYRNSPRYLKLWFMFILYLNTQHILPILYCLIDNNIGDKLAILYEAISYYQLLANK